MERGGQKLTGIAEEDILEAGVAASSLDPGSRLGEGRRDIDRSRT